MHTDHISHMHTHTRAHTDTYTHRKLERDYISKLGVYDILSIALSIYALTHTNMHTRRDMTFTIVMSECMVACQGSTAQFSVAVNEV